MVRMFGFVAALTIMIATQVSAQTRLELKYIEGSKTVVETHSTTHQVLTLAGTDIETTSSTFLIVSKSIGKRDSDGLLPIEETVNVLQTDIGLPGGTTLQFDSANPDKKADIALLEPIMERLRVTFKHPVTTILDTKNEIKEIRFPAGVAESVAKSNKSLFDPAQRKKGAEQARLFLPDAPVNSGDTWERSNEADLGDGQTMSFRTKYTYTGSVEQDGQTYDKITAKVFEASLSIDATNTMVQVSKCDLKVTESDVTILFDRQLGAVQRKTSKVRIQGPLTLVLNGTELDSKVDLTIEEKTKLQK